MPQAKPIPTQTVVLGQERPIRNAAVIPVAAAAVHMGPPSADVYPAAALLPDSDATQTVVLGHATTPTLCPVAGATGAGKVSSVQVVPPSVAYRAEVPLMTQAAALAQARESR